MRPNRSSSGRARADAHPLVVAANRQAGGIEQLEEGLAVLRTGERKVVEVELSDPSQLEECLRGVTGGTVVAAGGDGTLRVLVERLHRSGRLRDTVVGLLPLGTGNDLARTVGIPLDVTGAAAVVLSGSARPFDLLLDDVGTVAVNAVHGGVGGLAVKHAAHLKPLLRRSAYRVGAAWAGVRAQGWDLVVEVDGVLLFEGNALFVGIGNAKTIGGGTVLWPDARPDDGFADVLVVEAGSPLSKLRMAMALRSGDPAGTEGAVAGRGRSVRIEGEPVPYVADGDDGGRRVKASWAVEGTAWRLLVPAGDV